MKTEILENASKYYEKNFMAKQLSALEFLSDIAWDMNTAKRLIEIAKDDIAKYMTAGYHSEVVNQRRRALIEHEQNLKELQEKYNQLLTFLNENK